MKLSMKRHNAGFYSFFLAILFAISAFAATGDVDPTFNPILNVDATALTSGRAFVLPDGKLLLFGTHQFSSTVPSGQFMYKVNSDGTIDPTFDCPSCRAVGVGFIAVQPDGKLLMTTSDFTRLIRILPDGHLDLSFNIPVNSLDPNCVPALVIALPANKSLLGCSQDKIYRLNENGSVDPSYTKIQLAGAPSKVINQYVLLPDGKLLLGGGFSGSGGAGWIARHNTDGTVDNTFSATPSHTVRGVGLLADGRYIVTGSFLTINGVSKSNYATLFTDGSVDAGFTAARATNDSPMDVRTLPNGQFYVFTSNWPGHPNPTTYRFVRHNADGSIDNSFTQFNNNSFFWTLDSQGRIITHRSYLPGPGRYLRVNLEGTLDDSFNPTINAYGRVEATALQSDGKILVAGQFQKANGVPVIRFLRLNSNGTNDPTFDAGTGFSNAPDSLAVQADGRILAIGDFNGYNWFAQTRILRINANGSADTTFAPAINGKVYAVEPLANGKILIGGAFSTVNGVGRTGFAQLNSDGSLDTSFNPVLGGTNPTVYGITLLPDGKFFAAGSFGGVNGVDTRGLVLFKTDGNVETGFIVTDSSAPYSHIARRSDGKYIVANRISGNAGGKVFRLNSNGSRDWSFTERGGGNLNALYLQPNGNILLGVSGGRNIARYGPNGESDIYFPVFGANDDVKDIIPQPDGKILVGGWFSGIEDVGRYGIARLTLSNRIRGTAFDFDGDGRSDVSVYRPSTNTWYEILSGTGTVGVQTFGAAGDILAPADYDGDGKTDLGLYRPSIGDFLYILSSTNTVVQTHWGQNGDIPLPADYNADGIAGLVIYRPSTGTWFGTEGGAFNFGAPGDQPLIGDFDGDGKTDRAVFRPSTGDWWYAASSTPLLEFRQAHWGVSGDLPVPADYDGDSKTDYAVFRPSDGGWYINNSSNGSFTILAFGTNGDRPAPGDYDGDGRADIAVFRPSTGIWYLYQTTSGFAGLQFGVAGDIPTPNAFVP